MANPLLLLRSLLSVAILPVTMTVLVPLWVVGRWGTGGSVLALPLAALFWVGGAALLSLGLLLMSSTIAGFATLGRGTLAPWDPPRRLVVAGVYRYVRNPMISGVVLVQLAEAVLLRAPMLLAWAAAFAALNQLWIPLVEEPGLRQRFGADYREYCQHVPRWLPRRRPWQPVPSPLSSSSPSAHL
jgi:protein-S-isoprenylcysteine O-methyltransferase Ste14